MKITNSHFSRLAVSCPHRRPRSTAAFTTKTNAVLLVITGIVVAGVWLASSLIDFRNESDRVTDEFNIHKVSLNFTKLLKGAPPFNPVPLAVPSLAGADFCFYTPIMLEEGVLPEKMLWPSPPATRYSFNAFDSNHTMSCGGTVGSAQVSLACGGTDGACDATKPMLFAVRYNNVANKRGQNPCADLLMGHSSLAAAEPSQIVVTWSGGIQTIYSGNGSDCSAGRTCPLPVTTSSASTACNAGNPSTQTLTIDWYYQLGG